MKLTAKPLLLLTLLGAALAQAQPVPGQFQHVIIVIQENRTPDNLFAGVPPQNGWGGPWFQKGVDLAIAPRASQDKGGQPGQPWCFGACFDPGHTNPNWHSQHANGLPRQTKDPRKCGNTTSVTYCNDRPACGYWNSTWAGCKLQNKLTLPAWPEESYVSYTLDMKGSQHVLDPYVQIATRYGFGNYFYQTNQGPSQPAHDFLFGGTSAPSGAVGANNYYNYFAAANASSGCEDAPAHEVGLINPDGTMSDKTYPGVKLPPCFEHQTIADLLMSAGLTWKYYTNGPDGMWTAPNGIQHLCLKPGTPPGSPCDSPYFANVQPTKNFFADLPNATNCSLPSVAWIIPDGKSSDHPGLAYGQHSTGKEGGPNWVASIVNAVGNATCVEPSGPWKGYSPWHDTVIFVVWDDWGGWYDHVQRHANGEDLGEPYLDNFLQNGLNTGHCPLSYSGGTQYWGCGYTYGFRVPFLVVSAYTPSGTVSGACTQGVDCYPPYGDGTKNSAPHQHDFGSILAFIEYNFTLGIGCINSPRDIYGSRCPVNNNPGGIPFADYFAPEMYYDQLHGANLPPLGDFFPTQSPLGFAPITLVNNSFTLDYFRNFKGPFEDPDDE